MNVAPVSSANAMMSASLGRTERLAQLPVQEQVKTVAGQFEAIMLRQFLQESVGNIMGGQESGPGAGVYGYLLTDALANQLSAAGGLGLGPLLQQQLSPRGSLETVDAPSAQETSS